MRVERFVSAHVRVEATRVTPATDQANMASLSNVSPFDLSPAVPQDGNELVQPRKVAAYMWSRAAESIF